MKIVHVVYSLDMGGAESLVVQLARLQRARGHQVSVICQSNLGILGERLLRESYRVDVVGTGNPLLRFPRWWRLFGELRPDVVHCHNPAPTIQAAPAARLRGARTVLSTRHSLVAPPYNRKEERLYSIAARFCDWIVGICEATCINLRNAPGARPTRIVRVYNGAAPIAPVPPGEWPTADAPETRTSGGQPPMLAPVTLVFIGRLAAVKDLATLIRAFALAKQQAPNLRLWIVGNGPERHHLEALAAELGLTTPALPENTSTPAITFWGERHDVPRFLSAADIFVMSSTSEGLPMSLLQAMSAGLPALVTDVGGMAEVVQNANCGLRTPVGDPAAMAQAILRLAHNPGLRQQLAANGRAAYHQHFTLEHMEQAYADLYTRRPNK